MNCRNILLLMLIFLLVLAVAPMQARAVEVASGECGDDLTWVVDDQGVLTISGTGAMSDYNSWNLPWESNGDEIVAVVIGDGVTSIGKCAFYMLHNLERVDMGSGVTSIGESAFAYCDRLTEVTFSESLTTIGDSAFYDCDGLESLVLTDSITAIGESAFQNCSSLAEVEFSESLVTIGGSAFFGCEALEGVVFHEGLTTIGESAFYDCVKFTEVEFPESLLILGERAFYGCDELTGVKFNRSAAAIGDYAFYSCNNLIAVDLSDSITAIGNAAFKFCDRLTRVDIPSTVHTIGEEAFSDCYNFTKLTIGDGVKVIGNSAFANCGSLTHVTIPNSVTTVGASAFYSCYELETVIIGNGVTTIGESAFSSCYNLTHVTLGNSIATISESAFAYCSRLTGKLVIPDSVTTIGDRAFNGCTSLVNVVIPDSVTSLGESAFSGCGALAKVTLGNGIEKISDHTFDSCYSLTHVTIPDSVTIIGENAFRSCYGLVSVTIPSGVTVILQSAFDTCMSLSDVYYGGSEAQWDDISISRYNDDLLNATIHFNSFAGNVLRLAGDHRWDTALKVAEEMRVNLGVVKFDAIIIASGNDFADALAGSYLSTVKNAPILLSWGKGGKYESLDYNNIWYIQQNLAEGGTVYILGGKTAVPQLYEDQLSAYNVERLGGAHRFETNLLILEEAGVREGDEILVCTSTNFADSLSASATGKPILLVWNERGALYGDQPGFLAGLEDCTFTVIGGESAVSAKLATAIGTYGDVERLAGGNRFETSVMVAEKYFDEPTTAVLAYAWNYPDGLCGGSLAYSMDAPLVLTMTQYEAKAVDYATGEGIEEGVALGGTGLISDGVVRAVFTMDETDHILLK